MGPGESELIHVRMSLNKYYRNSSQLGPNPDWIASAANTDLAQVMIDTQHLICIQLDNEQKWAKVVEIREEGKLVNMQTEHGETFIMKTEGQDTTSGYLTLREAIQRTSPTLVRLSQLTEPNRIYNDDCFYYYKK